LPDQAWINPGQFAYSGLLEDNFPAILTEATQLVDGRLAAPAYGLADNAKADDPPYRRNPHGWREWRLFACGLWLEERCKSFPLTTHVIRQISASTPFLMNAIFMIMQPGAMLEPHHDNNNIFVSLWLPIIIPAKCAIKVAGITRVPEMGKCLAFNHSYEHSSWNFSDTARVVLNISHFHPDLTAEEQEAFAFLLPHMERYITEQESGARL
jgi:aspartyl/asparaginyl beta-hydroxylase (cupin superfamily)